MTLKCLVSRELGPCSVIALTLSLVYVLPVFQDGKATCDVMPQHWALCGTVCGGCLKEASILPSSVLPSPCCPCGFDPAAYIS